MTTRKMTAAECREFLLKSFFCATGAFALSKIIDQLHKLGCTGMNDSQIQAVSDAANGKKILVHVEDFHNLELRIFATFGPLTVAMYKDFDFVPISLLNEIEVVEDDWKERFEEAVKHLEECARFTEYHLEAYPLTHSKEDHDQLERVKSFLSKNK